MYLAEKILHQSYLHVIENWQFLSIKKNRGLIPERHSENRIRSGLREVVGSFYENLTAITETDGTSSEACRKYSSDCLQNMIQNELKHFETVVNVSFVQEIVTFALLKY